MISSIVYSTYQVEQIHVNTKNNYLYTRGCWEMGGWITVLWGTPYTYLADTYIADDRLEIYLPPHPRTLS